MFSIFCIVFSMDPLRSEIKLYYYYYIINDVRTSTLSGPSDNDVRSSTLGGQSHDVVRTSTLGG